MAAINLANGGTALVDDEDVCRLDGYRWLKNPHGYAVAYPPAGSGRKILVMSRLVMSADQNCVVDHINHDKLDNRKQNLRICSHAQNMRNRVMHRNNALGLKGVYVTVEYGRSRYRAQIRHDGKKISLGSFSDPLDAHKAYLIAAEKYHGEFASKQ